MAVPNVTLDCSLLATRNDFTAYIKTLFDATNGNLALVANCRPEICSALWGDGNPDISGIGMLVAYILEHALGLLTALALLASTKWSQSKATTSAFKRCLSVFHNSATFLTFSIQIAAMVVLVKVDFGISTNGMGDATVRITQAVSALTLLPMAYGVLLLRNSSEAFGVDSTSAETSTGATKEEDLDDIKHFPLFLLCWLLALYPFYSKLNSVFGSSKIGTAAPGVPALPNSTDQFAIIEDICFGDVERIALVEDRFMTSLAILAFVPLSALVIGRMIVLGIRKHHGDSKIYGRLSSALEKYNADTTLRWITLVLLGLVPLLASGLLWTVIRVQRFQNAMAAETGKAGADSQWTFGQVVAVTVFVPVLVEAWNVFRLRGKND